jgi:two-component system response regulator FlrC
VKSLQAYAWPGNIRELDNVVQRAMVMRTGEVIGEADLLFDQLRTALKPSEDHVLSLVESNGGAMDLKTQEMHLILSTLKKHSGHRQKTADELNLSARTLRYKLAKYKEQGYEVE